MRLNRYKREVSAAVAYALLLALVAIFAPSFFSAANLRDLALNNAPAMIVPTAPRSILAPAHCRYSPDFSPTTERVAGARFVLCPRLEERAASRRCSMALPPFIFARMPRQRSRPGLNCSCRSSGPAGGGLAAIGERAEEVGKVAG